MGEGILLIRFKDGKLNSKISMRKMTASEVSLMLSTLEIYKQNLLNNFIKLNTKNGS